MKTARVSICKNSSPVVNTVLNLILRMEKKIISILKNACFSGKGRQSLHICYENSKMLIYYVKLDHALYSINYSITRLEIETTPGKTFVIEVIAVGQRFGIVPAIVKAEFPNQNGN